jgi:GntR family transcriptional regulator of vanillate catabolism
VQGSRPEPASDSQNRRALLNLRELLLRGEFQPGERLSELPLVARLGVSRTPIRLALERLAQEGLLDAAPGGGFVVGSFSLNDIWDAIEIRGVLEGTAARLAAERLGGPAELTHLKRYLAEMDAFIPPNQDTFPKYLDLNEAFHAAVVDLAKSPMLRNALDRVFALPFASPSALVFARLRLPRAAEIIAIGQEHHHGICEAIENRQGTRAEALAREHARLARRNLEAALTNHEVLSAVPGGALVRLPESAEA